VTAGCVTVEYTWLVEVATPIGAVGLVGPNPVPHRITTSPGFAGTVAAPGNVPAFAANE
jgi:hypothetical protein